jgi:hypothetical protein
MLEFQLRLKDIIAESQAFQLALMDLGPVAQLVDLSANQISRDFICGDGWRVTTP